MRIEEIIKDMYVKIPDSVERELIKKVNQYFEADPELLAGSKEEIIRDLMKRTAPIINNAVKRYVLTGGLKEYINEELDKACDRLELAMAGKNKEIMKYTNNIKWNISTENVTELKVNEDIVIDITKDKFEVCVNGMLQTYEENYNIKVNRNDVITTIIFDKGDLIPEDVVELKTFIYKDIITAEV